MDLGPVVNPTGSDEHLIVVVAGFAESREDAERLSAEQTAHLVHWYVDDAGDYLLDGYYVRQRPATVEVACPEATDPSDEIVVEGLDVRPDELCSDAQSDMRFLLPAKLEYVPAGEDGHSRRREGCPDDPSLCASDDLLRLVAAIDPNETLRSGIEQRWVVLSAFRTLSGAEEYVTVAEGMLQRPLSVLRVRKLGATHVGLGQEADPDGTGPLLEPRPDPAGDQGVPP